MKKKAILFVSLLSIFLMLTIPNISAVEYRTTESIVNEKLNRFNINIYQSQKNSFFSTLTKKINDFKLILIQILAGILTSIVVTLGLVLSKVFETNKKISAFFGFLAGFIGGLILDYTYIYVSEIADSEFTRSIINFTYLVEFIICFVIYPFLLGGMIAS